jgi:hypothetical protein
LENRRTVARKKNVEIQREERSHALAQTRGIVDDFFRQKLAAARRVPDHRVADDEDLSLRPVEDDFSR